MNTRTPKIEENKSRSVANSVVQEKSSVKQDFGFVDNRSESVVQSKLLKMVNNRTQALNQSNVELVDSSPESELEPIQRVSINTPGGTVETDDLTNEQLDDLCRALEKLVYSTIVRNRWETEYHKAAGEQLKRSDHFGMGMKEEKEKKVPESFSYLGKTYNKKESSSGIYYQPDDFSKSSGSYVTIHNLATGDFYTHSHASRKKRCSAIWIGRKLNKVAYNDGETEMTDGTDKSIHHDIAVKLGLEFLKHS